MNPILMEGFKLSYPIKPENTTMQNAKMLEAGETDAKELLITYNNRPVDPLMNCNNKEVLRIMKGLSQEVGATALTHRFIPVPGYLNPNLVQCMYLGAMMAVLDSDYQPYPADMTAARMGLRLMKYKWPVYALTPELCEALIRTKPPQDFKWNELDWPIENAVFLIPDSPETREHFKSALSPIAISFGKMEAGELEVVENQGQRRIKVKPGGADIIASVTLYHDHGLHTLMTLAAVAAPGDTLDIFGQKAPHSLNPDLVLNDTDFLRQRRVGELCANILAFMASGYQPIPVPTEAAAKGEGSNEMARPASVKKGKEKEALFMIRMLGSGYRRKGPPLGGHHASPTAHWRAGHWRSQPYGPGRTLRRPRWIEPCFIVGEDEGETQ